jgi:CRISPR/Cas system-associated endonuclease Cas1
MRYSFGGDNLCFCTLLSPVNITIHTHTASTALRRKKQQKTNNEHGNTQQIASNIQRPTTNQQRTTNDQQTIDNKQQTTNNKREAKQLNNGQHRNEQ